MPAFTDNTLGVFEYVRALATIDIAAMEAAPPARRFEVYGTRGTAITEPFDPGGSIRLALTQPTGGYAAGEQVIELPIVTRQQLYERELVAFVARCAASSPGPLVRARAAGPGDAPACDRPHPRVGRAVRATS